MNINQLKKHCLSKPKATCDFPFDHETLVFRVSGKMFALTNINKTPCTVNLKCDPIFAMALRQKHKAVVPGYHMNKDHWNTVSVEEKEMTDKLVRELVDHSYELVFAKLPKKIRESIR
ncbi:MmcQ/YjbR family DNA-binding protein [Patescibacteria group bacterium]